MATPASLEILLTADDILTGLYAGLVEGQTRRIEANDVPHPLPGGLLRIIASLKPNTDTGKFSCIFEDCQVQLKSKADMKRHLKNEDHTSEETKQAMFVLLRFLGPVFAFLIFSCCTDTIIVHLKGVRRGTANAPTWRRTSRRSTSSSQCSYSLLTDM